MAYATAFRARRRVVVVVGAAACLVASVTGGFGAFASFSESSTLVSTSNGPALTSVTVTGDPGGTAITETVTEMMPGDYRERLVQLTLPSRYDTDVYYSVAATLASDATTSGGPANLTFDARNSVDARVTGIAATDLSDLSTGAGQGGLVVELYRCDAPNNWVSSTGVLGSSTADREYTCQDGVATPVGPKGNGIALGQADPLRAGWRQVSTAVPFACATRVDGTLYCWGSNGNGSTGLGLTSGETLVPTQVGTDSDWAQVGVGHVASCAVKTTGTLWCWGANIYGLTGQGVQVGSTNVPTQVGSDTDWRSVHGGRYFACATKTNNTIWCWGSNESGQTGLGTVSGTALTPTQVGTDSDWIQLTLGGVHNADGFACALKASRTLWCWGENGWGATGQATLVGDTLVPTQVGLSNQWGSVDAGEYHVCAVAVDTHIWCWGTNQYGVTALGTGLGSATVPTRTTLSAGWANVSAGGVHTCGVRTSGVMNCWGWGASSQAPPSPAGTTWVMAEAAPEVTAATTYSCAINSAGALFCFGYNDFGRTGLNTNTGITNPPAELITVANGEAYSTPTLIRSAGQPNLTILVRVRMPDDGTTDGRQNATGGESIMLTHRFTSSPVTAGAV